MKLDQLVAMFEGQDGEHHILEVRLADVRQWHTENEWLWDTYAELLQIAIRVAVYFEGSDNDLEKDAIAAIAKAEKS